MKTRHIVFIFLSFFSFVLAFTLFTVSQKVSSVRYQISTVDKAVDNEKDQMRVLRAEWFYLNRPARLESITLPDGLSADDVNVTPIMDPKNISFSSEGSDVIDNSVSRTPEGDDVFDGLLRQQSQGGD